MVMVGLESAFSKNSSFSRSKILFRYPATRLYEVRGFTVFFSFLFDKREWILYNRRTHSPWG